LDDGVAVKELRRMLKALKTSILDNKEKLVKSSKGLWNED